MVAQLDDKPRATHYAAPAMYELGRAGLLPDMKETGFHPDGVSWRKLDGTVLAGLDGTILKDDPDRMLCYPLHKLCPLLAQHLSRQKTAEVKYSHKVLGLGQNDDKAWIDVETPQGKQCMEADYIVGCDGANSQVRRSLFGDEFPGKTWDEQVVATNVSGKEKYKTPLEKEINGLSNIYSHAYVEPRHITTSTSTATMIPTSSSTPSIGTWSPASAKTECGVSPTERSRDSASTNSKRGSP